MLFFYLFTVKKKASVNEVIFYLYGIFFRTVFFVSGQYFSSLDSIFDLRTVFGLFRTVYPINWKFIRVILLKNKFKARFKLY